MSERVDCVVIGAGVVGLAIARALAVAGREVTIVEAEPTIGTGVSSRNSEVIHAGLYYPPASLKAALCVRGRALLYAYCADRQVPHRRVGKLIVATDDAQRPALEAIRRNAVASKAGVLQPLDVAEAAALEPDVTCVAALWSPETGIVDTHALMLALLADAEAAGAVLALSSRVVGGAVAPDGVAVDVSAGDERTTLVADLVVNAASLDASRVARAIGGVAPSTIPRTRPVKGNYFSLLGATPFRHLVYPLPADGGLGVHVTLDLAGRARFGPDVQWPDEVPDAPRDASSDAGPDPSAATRPGAPNAASNDVRPGASNGASNEARPGPSSGASNDARFATSSGASNDARPGASSGASNDARPGASPAAPAVAPLDYAVDETRIGAFAEAIRRYWPALPDSALAPAYSGMRPKIHARDEPPADFVIAGPSQHGVRGLVHLFGIESPGLTASLAIGEHVARMAAAR